METPAKMLKEDPDVSWQKENITPTKAKRARKCLSLQRRKKQLFPKSRFKTFLQSETLLSMSKGYIPSNTLNNTKLAIIGWNWLEKRNSRAAAFGKDGCPVALLSSTDHSDLSSGISLFTSETAHTDGSLYPAKTLYQLLCGLLLYMKSKNHAAPNFLDGANHTFAQIRT